MATAAILKSKILEVLYCIAKYQSQKDDIKETNILLQKKMQQLEFIFKLNFWKRILQSLHRVSQVLQNKDVNFKTSADLYGSLADQLCTS